MSFRRRSGSYARSVVRATAVIAALAAWPRAAAGEETITAFMLDVGAAARLTVGTETGADFEGVISGGMLRLGTSAYSGYAVELSYAGSDSLDVFSVMPRFELGLSSPRFNARVSGKMASVWVPYIAVAAGYGSGYVWDTEYIELYGSEEAVEVAISGVPVMGAVGFRRLGGVMLRFEIVGSAFWVTSEEPDLPEGDAPSLIPSIGVRFAFGADSFTYTWI